MTLNIYIFSNIMYLEKCSMSLIRMCILLLLDGVVSRYQLFVLIDDAVEFNHILTDFLLAVYLHF